jgi:hypothetical protein
MARMTDTSWAGAAAGYSPDIPPARAIDLGRVTAAVVAVEEANGALTGADPVLWVAPSANAYLAELTALRQMAATCRQRAEHMRGQAIAYNNAVDEHAAWTPGWAG